MNETCLVFTSCSDVRINSETFCTSEYLNDALGPLDHNYYVCEITLCMIYVEFSALVICYRFVILSIPKVGLWNLSFVMCSR